MSILIMYNLKSKHSIFVGLILLTHFLQVYPQTILTKEGYGLTAPCEFQRTPLEYFNPGNGGDNCLWDFSELSIPKRQQKLIQRIDSLGKISVTDDRQITYYKMSGDSLVETGSETPLKSISYHKPIYSMVYPMALGDSIGGTFEGYGIYCGDHYSKEAGINCTIVDGSGDIVLSETDTIRNVVRVYKLRSYSIAMDMDPYRIDSTGTKQVIEEKYEWYTKGYSKPIFETITNTSYADMVPLGTAQYAYCCLPENQEDRIEDGFPESRNEKDTTNTGKQIQDIFHYKMNVDQNHVNIDYSLDAKANMTMIISDYIGRVYFNNRYTQKAGMAYNTSFDITALLPGVYVLYINVNGKIYNEKIRK